MRHLHHHQRHSPDIGAEGGIVCVRGAALACVCRFNVRALAKITSGKL